MNIDLCAVGAEPFTIVNSTRLYRVKSLSNKSNPEFLLGATILQDGAIKKNFKNVYSYGSHSYIIYGMPGL